jgi:hypothetical protein
MDEIEDYSETVHEQSDEHAEHLAHASGGKEKWVIWVALSTAVIAVFAAITGLMAGTSADERQINGNFTRLKVLRRICLTQQTICS